MEEETEEEMEEEWRRRWRRRWRRNGGGEVRSEREVQNEGRPWLKVRYRGRMIGQTCS
jgi:hypothetical protein